VSTARLEAIDVAASGQREECGRRDISRSAKHFGVAANQDAAGFRARQSTLREDENVQVRGRIAASSLAR
jgi:hypothetical protein